MANNSTKLKAEDRSKLDLMEKPVVEMTDDELDYLLDVKWYPRANEALDKQRKIWDYSYLAYKGIMLWDEVNRKRRSNGFGLFVNVPRTFATIEAIRRNFNINQLKIDIEKTSDLKVEKIYKMRSFLNHDLDRSGTRDQIKDAGFNKLLYGNGFLYSFLVDRSGKYYNITGEVDKKTGRVACTKDDKSVSKYYGLVARSISPYKIFPDPDGVTHDVDDNVNRLCNYTFIRTVKHIANFRRDWAGIIPDEILSEVQPGGKDMTNYEAVKDTIDYMFDYDNLRYVGSVQDYVSSLNVKKVYDTNDQMVEERICIGEDFMVVKAGKGLKVCLVSPNPNPKKNSNLVKMDDVIVPGEYWAMGQPYILRYQQIEENRVHNSILDMIHFAVSGMVGVNANYLEDPTDIEIYPGKAWKFKAIPGTSISDVLSNFQPSSSAIKPALAFMQEIKATGQQTTSITDFVIGASKSISDTTATATNRLAGAADLAIVDKIREMVSGAMIQTCKNWFSMYPVVYKGEKMKLADNGNNLYYIGKSLDSTSEEELAKLLKDYSFEDLIFEEDFDMSNPKFKITGDIEISKDVKFQQWVAAINFAKDINDQAFNTGDPRRIDVIQMGMDAMSNFDVISDPSTYKMAGQKTKEDLNNSAAMAGANANMMQADHAAANNPPANESQPSAKVQKQNGGAPKTTPSAKPLNGTQTMRANAQPK